MSTPIQGNFYLPHHFHEYTGREIHNEKEKSMLTASVCISSHSEVFHRIDIPKKGIKNYKERPTMVSPFFE